MLPPLPGATAVDYHAVANKMKENGDNDAIPQANLPGSHLTELFIKLYLLHLKREAVSQGHADDVITHHIDYRRRQLLLECFDGAEFDCLAEVEEAGDEHDLDLTVRETDYIFVLCEH